MPVSKCGPWALDDVYLQIANLGSRALLVFLLSAGPGPLDIDTLSAGKIVFRHATRHTFGPLRDTPTCPHGWRHWSRDPWTVGGLQGCEGLTCQLHAAYSHMLSPLLSRPMGYTRPYTLEDSNQICLLSRQVPSVAMAVALHGTAQAQPERQCWRPYIDGLGHTA